MTKLLTLLFLLSIISCNEDKPVSTTDTGKVHSNTANTFDTSARLVDLNGCYEMTLNRDTASMKLNIADTTVNGQLVYDWSEKDGNVGTITGVLKDSLIYADYTFESEGLTSVREVIFKLTDTLLQQAVGDLTEKDNKIIYKDKTKLDFNTMPPFIKVPCPADN